MLIACGERAAFQRRFHRYSRAVPHDADQNADEPPPLTEEERARLAALDMDDPVDLGDVPLASGAFVAKGLRDPFYRPLKEQVTLRLDADVLAWLRSGERGYRSRVNAILREAMEREREDE